MEQLLNFDKRLFLFLNGLHTPFLDEIMYFLTETYGWIPMYALLIYLITKKFGIDTLWVLLGVAITILLSDQITSGFMKPYFARLRPTHEPSLEGLIHTVRGYRGGQYGFASSHAANTFGVALFIWLSLRHYYKWIWMIFAWAALMTYTRIYLGVHYPTDILVGGLVGASGGWIGYKCSSYLIDRNKKSPLLH
jgi:undecaprenyl-diphosphatase